MKPKNKLPKILYYLSNISYYISLVTVGFIFLFDLISGFSIDINYNVPVSIKYTSPVVEDDGDNKSIYTSQFIKYKDGEVITDKFEPTEKTIWTSGDISIHPKSVIHKTILIIRQYALYFLSAFIAWHLAQLFKKLSTDFTFSKSLKKHLNIIGISIIAIEAIKLTLSFINKSYISNIKNVISVPHIPKSEYTMSNFKVIYDVDIMFVFIGAAILCLGSLLAYGQQIQEENELTI